MTAREYHHAVDATEYSTTETGIQIKLTLTFTAGASGDYLILATCAAKTSGAYRAVTRLKRDTTDQVWYRVPDNGTDIYSSQLFAVVNSLVADTSYSYTLGIAAADGGTAYIKNMSIVAIKMDSNDKYTTGSAEATSTSWVDVCTLTFDPGTASDYLLITSVVLGSDNSGTNTFYPEYRIYDSGSTARATNILRCTNDNQDLPAFGCHLINLTSGSKTIKTQVRSSDSTNHITASGTLIALRLDGFDDYSSYQDDDSTGGSTTSTTWDYVGGDSIYEAGSPDDVCWLKLLFATQAADSSSYLPFHRVMNSGIGGADYDFGKRYWTDSTRRIPVGQFIAGNYGMAHYLGNQHKTATSGQNITTYGNRIFGINLGLYTISLIGSSTVTSSVVGNLENPQYLAGNSDAISSVTSKLEVTREITSLSSSVSSVTGDLLLVYYHWYYEANELDRGVAYIIDFPTGDMALDYSEDTKQYHYQTIHFALEYDQYSPIVELAYNWMGKGYTSIDISTEEPYHIYSITETATNNSPASFIIRSKINEEPVSGSYVYTYSPTADVALTVNLDEPVSFRNPESNQYADVGEEYITAWTFSDIGKFKISVFGYLDTGLKLFTGLYHTPQSTLYEGITCKIVNWIHCRIYGVE